MVPQRRSRFAADKEIGAKMYLVRAQLFTLLIFDGVAEANLIALACREPPKGRAR